MKENHIIINKTARYYTAGELSEKTKRVWFVLHGHGQQAKFFLEKFESLMDDTTFFIAPEGLNRYYVTGASGNTGVTWMTKEDRLNEIKDYINYLDDIYEFFEFEKFSVKVTGLGFSQGSSTLTRWVNITSHKIDNVIVFAGEVAAEILPLNPNSNLLKTKNYFIYGNKDQFFPADVIDKMKASYTELNFKEIAYNGGHSIQPEILKNLPV